MFMCDRLWHRAFVCIDWLTDRMHQLMICCNFLVSKSLVPMWLNFHAGNNKTIHSTLEKYWAGLKTKVKTIDKLGEKITINTDQLYLLSLILCTLRLLLRNKPYGISNRWRLKKYIWALSSIQKHHLPILWEKYANLLGSN